MKKSVFYSELWSRRGVFLSYPTRTQIRTIGSIDEIRNPLLWCGAEGT